MPVKRTALYTIYYENLPVCSFMATGRADALEQFIADLHAEHYRERLSALRAVSG